MAHEEAPGKRLIFRALAADGRPLANGVYLYLITIRKADGEVLQSKVHRLVVLR